MRPSKSDTQSRTGYAVEVIPFATFGWACLAASPRGLARIALVADPAPFMSEYAAEPFGLEATAVEISHTAAAWLGEYLQGARRSLGLPVDWSGIAPFQRGVLEAAAQIPYGQTRTYGQVAQIIGHGLKSSRAVGGALAANPIPIVLPCHRVIGGDGRLHGFAAPGGVHVKAWLLALEGFTLPFPVG